METESKPLAVGDVVKLKSGGPTMTLYKITPPKNCICQWFEPFTDAKDNKINNVRKDVFALDSLERVTPS